MKIRRKKNYIIFVLLLLVCISVGYAVINTTLNINGKSSISKNTWDVYFDNVVVRDGSVEAVKIPAISDKTTVDFEVTLNLPGDFYEFTVDVVNDGSIDAMIDNIEKTPDLSTEQQKYLNYTITYENDEAITTKQLVKKEEFVRLKVRVEYKSNLTATDLPTNNETLILGFNVNYVQADVSGVNVNNNGVKVINVVSGDINEIGTIVTIGDQQFYTIGTEVDNVKLLSMYNLYVGNSKDENRNVTPLANPTGKQSELAKGYEYDSVNETDKFPIIGTTPFSSDVQKGTNYSDYVGSIVEGYVNNYKNIIETDYGIDIVEARLITYDELTNSETFACEEFGECSDKYPWIYSTTYWSGSAYNATYVWFVYSIDRFGYYSYIYDDGAGVRPVIVISKSLF